MRWDLGLRSRRWGRCVDRVVGRRCGGACRAVGVFQGDVEVEPFELGLGVE